MAFKTEEEKRLLIEKSNMALKEKYEKTMEELKETYNFLISVNGEFAEVEQEAQDLKDLKQLHTQIYKFTRRVNE